MLLKQIQKYCKANFEESIAQQIIDKCPVSKHGHISRAHFKAAVLEVTDPTTAEYAAEWFDGMNEVRNSKLDLIMASTNIKLGDVTISIVNMKRNKVKKTENRGKIFDKI